MSVHFNNPYNSTIFTNCCGTAILDDEKNCPGCDEKIIYGDSKSDTNRIRWNIAMKKQKKRY